MKAFLYLSILGIGLVIGAGVTIFFGPASDRTALQPTYTSDVVELFCPDNAPLTVQYSDTASHAKLSLSGVQYELTRTQAASGAKYESENGASIWEHQSEVTVLLPGLLEPLICTLEPPASDDASQSELITVYTPAANETVGNPIALTGEARGYWFFEATAPVVVTNWDGLIIGESYVTAEGEWMTEDFVPFSGTIEYDLPADSYSTRGTVILMRSNPSGLPENDAAVEIPVTLSYE